MMRIRVTQRFKSGRDIYEKDDERTVSDESGAHFVRAGWAVEVGAPAVPVDPSGEVTLEIHSATHAAGDSNG